MTMHEMMIRELAAVGLQMGDLTKPGAFHTLSNGRRIWTQLLEQEEPIEDLFGANQSSLLMTLLCPECTGSTHTIFTAYGDYRQCDADCGHMRVRVK